MKVKPARRSALDRCTIPELLCDVLLTGAARSSACWFCVLAGLQIVVKVRQSGHLGKEGSAYCISAQALPPPCQIARLCLFLSLLCKCWRGENAWELRTSPESSELIIRRVKASWKDRSAYATFNCSFFFFSLQCMQV